MQVAWELEQLQAELTAAHNQKYAGQELDVLIEEVMNEEGLAIGRAWFQTPEVDGSVVVSYDIEDKAQCKAVVPGAVVKVKVLASTGVDLDSRLKF